MSLTYKIPAADGFSLYPGQWVEIREAYQLGADRGTALVSTLRVRSRSGRFSLGVPAAGSLRRLRPHEGRIFRVFREADYRCFQITFA
jgi:hypothetical protein